MTSGKKAIVIGAGIVGLAVARALAIKGYRVKVIDRSAKAVGASVRNFGMIWPIGQPEGILYERALRSKAIWKKVCSESGLWHSETGSLHLAYNELEWNVLQEFAAASKNTRPVAAISASEALQKTEAANPLNLRGALWSADEMIIESRVVMEQLPFYLQKKIWYSVLF